ncbi:MAG: DUF1848 domain-containing protein [Syntrophomonas sp.]
MIISASRRTDIPAFYSDWFMNRIRDGYCTVVNPFNHNQVSRVSLKIQDVDVIVFWTKNPAPMIPNLKELDGLGYRYYFQYTLNGYSRDIEPSVPVINKTLSTFIKLADQIGPEKVIWRYDPIILSDITGLDYHKKQIDSIARKLEGSTKRLIISVVDEYRKAGYNFNRLEKNGIAIKRKTSETDVEDLVKFILDIAAHRNMQAYSCAEILDLRPFGLMPGKCVDDSYINSVFDINVTSDKDKSQRLECGCVRSKDIGVYDSCLHGCLYCYAGTMAAAQKTRKNHFPDSPSLIGRYDAKPEDLKKDGPQQITLF